MIAWDNVTNPEMKVIRRIATRSHTLLAENDIEADYRDVQMDISATHAGCPLDLQKLETADDSNFAHDIFGIRRHLDRETGELRDCFMPRCAR